ncbi:MAG: hypothetical protein AB7K04_02640 [Pseudorhodoplanes sp.]
MRLSRGTLACLLAFCCGLGGCANGDFGRVRPSLVTDDMHAWVGVEAAAAYGQQPSLFPLTDDERLLRDLAYPLIEPPYDRQRWYSVLGEYGLTRVFQRGAWTFDVSAYATRLNSQMFRSATGRYQQLNEDVRNDIERLDPFFTTARRVLDMDRKREKSLAFVEGLSGPEAASVRARNAENTLIVGWVHRSLSDRAASYRFALEHLVIATPSPLAVEAERSIALLQLRIGQNRLAPPPIEPGRAIAAKG